MALKRRDLPQVRLAKTELARERREKLYRRIKERGLALLPSARDLAEEFGVSHTQINKDLKVIRSLFRPQNPDAVALQYSIYADAAIEILNEKLSKSKGLRSTQDILAQMSQILKDEVTILNKLGLIAPSDIDSGKVEIVFVNPPGQKKLGTTNSLDEKKKAEAVEAEFSAED